MDFLNVIIDFGLPFLFVLTVLVFVHEMGHYLLARYFGVRVEVFSIGFGPELFGWTDKAQTRWKFSLIPLGGYVKMFGDADAASRPGHGSEMTDEEKSVSFHHKPLGQKSWIIAGGPLANFVLAIIFLAGLFAFVGQPFTTPKVGGVQPESAAEAAGIQVGDIILAIDGEPIERFEQIQRIVQVSPEKPLEILVQRGNEQVTLLAIPQRAVQDNLGRSQEVGRLGVTSSGVDYVRHGPVEALWRGIEETGALSLATLQAVGEIITGTRSTNELGGVIRIAEVSGEAADIGFSSIIWLMAVLSINLGLINLFPIPILDGGHLLFYAIEVVIGRPLGEKAQEYGFRIGLALVLSLFVFVTWNDLVHLNVF